MIEKATFAAGCFWGIEHRFREVPGVIDARSGYTGGHTESPTYKQVCTGTTGHAEAVEISFEPQKISFEQLLEKFWSLHNPTQFNRQGPDVGTQYRSAIFYHDDRQKDAAEISKQAQQEKYKLPVVTEVVPAAAFWEAEEYHQQYIAKHGGACHI